MYMTESIKRQTGRRWWLVAAIAAFALTALTSVTIYLITRKPSTVDQLVILTVPSGAEVKLNSTGYGFSPVKLEQLPVGIYTLTISKEGFETITEEIPISESHPHPLEYKLKKVFSSESSGLSLEEKQRRAEEAFTSGRYGVPFDESALYYANLISQYDPSNPFAVEMLEKVRKALHEQAEAAIKAGDMVLAKDTYDQLLQHYPEDKDAQAGLARLNNQLLARKGEVLDLVRKAEESMRQGNFVEPDGASAHYFAKQVLLIDPKNTQAQTIIRQVRERLLSTSEFNYANGDEGEAIRQLASLKRKFPNDTYIAARLREWSQTSPTEKPKPVDAKAMREEGLRKYLRGNYDEAIHDLQVATTNNQGTPDVIFALGYSYWKAGNRDQAVNYLRRVPSYADGLYRSSIAVLGDISLERGDTAEALRKFKEAKDLGGSTLYSIAKLDDRIERIENRQRQKADEPKPVSVSVKHVHGGIFGDRSCQGSLIVDSTGVSYKSNEHNFSANLVAVGVSAYKDEMTVTGMQSKPLKFKLPYSEAERFRSALSRFQSSARK